MQATALVQAISTTGVSFEIILDLFSKGKVCMQIINKTTGTALMVKSRV